MKTIQLKVPNDIYDLLINHPDCPGWHGRRKWILQILIDFINSPAFRIGIIEEENRRLRETAKSVDFWKERAGGWRSLFKPNPSTPQPAEPVPLARLDQTTSA